MRKTVSFSFYPRGFLFYFRVLARLFLFISLVADENHFPFSCLSATGGGGGGLFSLTWLSEGRTYDRSLIKIACSVERQLRGRRGRRDGGRRKKRRRSRNPDKTRRGKRERERERDRKRSLFLFSLVILPLFRFISSLFVLPTAKPDN